MSQIVYFLRESLRGFFQAKLMAVVSIITIAVSLFIAALACIVVDNLYALYRQVHDCFGTNTWKGDCSNVMKRLIEIRAKARGN